MAFSILTCSMGAYKRSSASDGSAVVPCHLGCGEEDVRRTYDRNFSSIQLRIASSCMYLRHAVASQLTATRKPEKDHREHLK